MTTIWRSLEAWKKYGIERGYEQKKVSSLVKSENKEDRSWHTKGYTTGWLGKFNFDRKCEKWKKAEEWIRDGIKRGYEQRNPHSLAKSEDKEERSWYSKGYVRSWLKKFNFDRFLERWKSFEEWKKYGINKGYDGRNPFSLEKSKDPEERSWYYKGNLRRWSKKFNFDRLRKNKWKNIDEWLKDGIERGYNQRNPGSLARSEDREDRSWYLKGNREGWSNKFNFKKLCSQNNIWEKLDEWRQEGIERGYEQRKITNLAKSGDKEDRIWYKAGFRKKWLKDFRFNSPHDRWKNADEWKKYGIERGYEQINPASLSKSENKEHRSWYSKGYLMGWTQEFNFNRVIGTWKNVDEWEQYGIERGYNQRNPASLSESEDNKERRWYNVGGKNGWLEEFNFRRKKTRLMNDEHFNNFIKKDENAQKMAYAATNANGFSYDIEKIIMDTYDGKFKDQKELHDLLNNNAAKIKALVENGVTNLGAYIGAFSIGERKIFPIVEMAVDAIPMDKMTGPLEKRVASMLRIGYSPKFNDNPAETIKELEGKVYSSNEKMRSIYEGLLKHYNEVVCVMEELD